MKKLFSLFLALAMVLTLCACGNANVATNDATDSSTEATSGNATEDNNTVASNETTEQSTESTEKRPSRLPTEDLYEELPASCEHDLAEADCTTPKTCTICSFELGDPLGHDFSNGICARCGASEGAEDEAAE